MTFFIPGRKSLIQTDVSSPAMFLGGYNRDVVIILVRMRTIPDGKVEPVDVDQSFCILTLCESDGGSSSAEKACGGHSYPT